MDNEQGVKCACEVKSEFPWIIWCSLAWTSSQELFCSKYFTLEIASSSDGHIIFPQIPTIPSIALMNAGTQSQENLCSSFKRISWSQHHIHHPNHECWWAKSKQCLSHCESYYSLCHGWIILISPRQCSFTSLNTRKFLASTWWWSELPKFLLYFKPHICLVKRLENHLASQAWKIWSWEMWTKLSLGLTITLSHMNFFFFRFVLNGKMAKWQMANGKMENGKAEMSKSPKSCLLDIF